MRKSVTKVVVSVILSMLGVAEAAYIIKLKNGNEYVTNRYWHEGTQVLFDTDGGVFGIEKVFVGKIEQTDKVIRLIAPVSEKLETAPKEKPDDATKEAPMVSEKPPANKDQNDPIYKEFIALKAESDSLLSMSRGELDEFAKRVVGLIGKIQTDRKINQYLQEYSQLNALANRAEDTIKSRR